VSQQFTIAEQLDAIDREIRFRRHVYPRRVAESRMSQKEADRQIALMEAVKATVAKIGREQKELDL
jgi:hypothetical protein